MSGDIKLSAVSLLKERDSKLDTLEESYSLPSLSTIPNKNKAQEIMELEYEQLQKLDKPQCDEYVFVLSQYAFAINRLHNKEISRAGWADKKIKSSLAGKVANYKGYSYEERLMAATMDDSFTKELYNIKTYAQQRADRLKDVSSYIKDLAQSIRNLGYGKTDNNRNIQ